MEGRERRTTNLVGGLGGGGVAGIWLGGGGNILEDSSLGEM